MEDRLTQNLDIFKELDDAEVPVIKGLLRFREYAPGQMVYKEGDMGDNLNILVKGKVRINKTTVEGDQFCIATLKEGDIFGTMSFLDGSTHDATIVSDQETHLSVLEKSDFECLGQTDPLIAVKVLRRLAVHLASIVRNMNGQYLDLMNLMFRKSR
jgi:CRP-like cAMP-binding protein